MTLQRHFTKAMKVLALALLVMFAACASSRPARAQKAEPQVIERNQTVMELPGKLDEVEVFNSNSPEMVENEGILLSTFAPAGKVDPAAHLEHPLKGRFDIFVHHINNGLKRGDTRTLHVGLLVGNAGSKTVHLKVRRGASYLSRPDAPFITLPAQEEDPNGLIFAGPGDRVTNDMLRKLYSMTLPPSVVLKKGEMAVLFDLPVPIKSIIPPVNGRSTLLQVQSDGPVYVASLAKFMEDDGSHPAPTADDWMQLLDAGKLAGSRDIAPSVPGAEGPFKYGRVAGVARGSRWNATVSRTISSSKQQLEIKPGETLSYVISSVDRGTLGTKAVQSAPLVVRYPDTAYRAHGNYAVQYDLKFPLYNPSDVPERITILWQTPLKESNSGTTLKFYSEPEKRVFFRGTVNLRYKSDSGKLQNKYFHLVQNRGEEGSPLTEITLAPHKSRMLEVHFLYPPDATPPQVLTLKAVATGG